MTLTTTDGADLSKPLVSFWHRHWEGAWNKLTTVKEVPGFWLGLLSQLIMYVKAYCVVLNHISSDSHSSHTVVNIQVSCLSSSSLKLGNWYSCSHTCVSKRPSADFAIHHNTAKEQLDVTSYVPCILSLACNWSIQGKFHCTSNPIKVALTWSLGLGSCTASRLTLTRDGHFECKWSYYMYIEWFYDSLQIQKPERKA